jgi:hypothetical protein
MEYAAASQPIGQHKPQWIPDEHAPTCMSTSCNVKFDFMHRRHHCRCCGGVHCNACAPGKAMLPPEWGVKDPQRVCLVCDAKLRPFQAQWVGSNANSLRENSLSDDKLTRNMNSPLRMTLGGEIRKAAYTLSNLMEGVNFHVKDAKYNHELLNQAQVSWNRESRQQHSGGAVVPVFWFVPLHAHDREFSSHPPRVHGMARGGLNSRIPRGAVSRMLPSHVIVCAAVVSSCRCRGCCSSRWARSRSSAGCAWARVSSLRDCPTARGRRRARSARSA